MNERLRIISKRIDHVERAYRKFERPLLGQDYAEQQTLDRQIFEQVQSDMLAHSKSAHKQDLETKGRLKRMLGDYGQWRGTLVEKKGDAFKKKEEAARRKIESEKAKRREAVLKALEEEREREEREEEERQALEEEERLKEEGLYLSYQYEK